MKTTKINLILLAFLSLTFAQCNDIEQIIPEVGAIDIGKSIEGSLIGIVVDENDNPVEGAIATLGTETAETDEFGIFEFFDADMNEKHAFVKVEQPGYLLGSRSIMPTSGINKVSIKLLPATSIGTVEANTGGIVSLDDIEIIFEAGFVDANGNAYNGDVTVKAAYIDPNAEDLSEIMPGSLRANSDEGETLLKTFGMIGVELEDAFGNQLQIADGKSAEIVMPIPANMLADAPETIPLWHFDEDKGYWIEDGTATKIDGKYVGSVSHFSFWNCDIKVDNLTSYGRLIDQNGNPLQGYRIGLASPNAGTRYGYTCSEGKFGGLMPAGVAMVVKLYEGNNNTPFADYPIAALSEGDQIGDIVFEIPNLIKLIGRLVDCDGNGVEGVVRLNNTTYIETDSKGKFECSYAEGKEAVLKPISKDKNIYGEYFKMTMPNEDTEIGDLVLCKVNQGIWVNTIVGMRVSYTIYTQDYSSSSNFSVVDMSVWEDLEIGVYRLKMGKDNGYTSDEYLTLDIPTYSGVGSYEVASGSDNYMNFYTGNSATTQIEDYVLNVTIKSVDIGPQGENDISFNGHFKENGEIKIVRGIIDFTMF